MNGCRQTSQYSTSNPHNSSLLINILWSKRLRVCKKQIHQVILTSNCSFWPKYESSIHNNASSSEKVHSLLSSRDSYWIQKHQFEIKNDLMDLLQSQISPNLFRWGCKLIYILDVLRASRFELISIFLLTIPLNQFFQKKKSNLTSVKTKKKKICLGICSYTIGRSFSRKKKTCNLWNFAFQVNVYWFHNFLSLILEKNMKQY